MTSIIVFVFAFCVGCLTGVVVELWSRDVQIKDSSRAPLFWGLPADE